LNFTSVVTGEYDIGWTHAALKEPASKGEAPFDKVYTGICSISTMHPADVSFMVRKDSEVTSIADLADKNVAFLTPGSTAYFPTLRLMEEEYGITPESIEKNGGTVNYMAQAEAAAALQDNQVDVFVQLFPHPATPVVEMDTTFGIRLLGIEKDKMANFLKKYPNWQADTIKAGTYSGMTSDINTLVTYMFMGVKDTMDEELAYQLTKTLWENIDDLYAVSADAKRYSTLELAVITKDVVPLHPGSERYFKEIGVIK
jgi:TRAP transporter TAXI family solute receptor